ncbi:MULTISPECIES: efflux RND transporter periplasmic adaptor subunit [Methylomonas]|uniref:efflux RND transporter periplasmic adaptor subunit n=1 Tax=Methylomonas TaxID=416 RepID=UPI001232A9C4|nr:efflux RND transporter periplasmic adaptor subunit [Methylomonas rhizoryzae]
MTISKIVISLTLVLMLLGIGLAVGNNQKQPVQSEPANVANPALSVTIVQPQMRQMPNRLTANGSIAAWQEAVIGAEIGDLRLAAVKVQVGEFVKKGQVLADFAEESVLADLAQARALVAEAEANLAEAQVNAERARKASLSGAFSAQQVDQYTTAAKTAAAKLQSAHAQLQIQQLRLKHTKVLASDDGVISSRSATLGAVATNGQELFRLIRGNRLEWRGEVTAAEMTRLRPGVGVTVEVPNVGSVTGTLRFLAPTLDEQSRNGLVYVDLPDAAAKGLRAGMFARGEFALGDSAALTVPQDALSLREGFSYVFRVHAHSQDQAQVEQVKVQIGRRDGNHLEILAGLQADDRLVASGASFLADGDNVRVVMP